MSILDEAKALVYGDRNDSYGHPFDDFSRTAKLWSVILGTEVKPEQVALCMIAVKISRLCQSPAHRDSVIDAAGYAATYQMVIDRANHDLRKAVDAEVSEAGRSGGQSRPVRTPTGVQKSHLHKSRPRSKNRA